MLKKRIFQTSFLLCLGAFVFLFFYNPIWGGGDIWGHLSTGKWITEHFQVPHYDVFPFADEKTPWLCHNEWLGSVLLYLIVKCFGLLGLKVFRSVFCILIISILFGYSYKRLPFSFLTSLLVLGTLGLEILGRTLRPDMFNYFFIPVFLIILFDHEDTGNRKKLWILPVLSLVWFNIHLGSLVFGMSILSIFFLSACIRCSVRQIKDLALIGLACLAGFMVNPYGMEGFVYPFKVFFFPGYIGYYKFVNLITEAQPAGYIFTSWAYFYYFILLAWAALVLFFNKKNNFTLAILLAVSLFSFLYFQRNSAFFAVVCAYVIADGSRRIKINEFWQSFRFSKTADGLLLAGAALFLLTQSAAIWLHQSYSNGRIVNNRFIVVDHVSQGPVQLLIKNNIKGPVFNNTMGGQMIWSAYPDLKPFHDWRNFPERFNNQMAVFQNPPEVWPQALKDYHFKIVVLSTTDPMELNFLKYLGTQRDWQLIALCGNNVTYVKRGEFHLTEELDRFEARLKSSVVTADDLRTLKKLSQPGRIPMFTPLLQAGDIDLYLSVFALYGLDYKAAAVKDLIRVLKISDQSEIRYTAGLILKQFE